MVLLQVKKEIKKSYWPKKGTISFAVNLYLKINQLNVFFKDQLNAKIDFVQLSVKFASVIFENTYVYD